MRAVLVFAVAAVTGAAAAQGPSTFEIPRTSAAPVIDGRVDPAEWAGAARVEVDIEYQPADNRPADVRAEALIMEDGETLFVAFLAEDPDTSSIRAYFKDRDAIVVDDWMSVVLDTFNDERRAYAFTVNPLGVQADAIFDDVNGRLDDSWNGIWDSAGRIIESGYSVELAIPFKQLRFSDTDSVQTWGVDFVRRYPRDQVTMISSNPRDRDISCYLCQIAKADGFDNLERGRNLEIIPTVTASASKDRPSGQGDWLGADESEGGLDVRWGITPDMYLNATLNPDFSQVEADSPQLDVNNTFALFFPERRTFFLDGSDYFETRQNLVHTRTIAEPEYGAKLTGKSGAHTFGLLAANDRSTSFVIPGSLRSSTASLGDTPSDVAIGRYRADIFGNSTIGALVTDRQGSGYRNTVMSLDTLLRPTDQDTIAIQAMRSRSSYPGQIQRDFGQQADIAGDNLFVEYSHADRRWDWRVGYFDVGEDFRADLGFINRVDYKHVVTTVGHTWRWGRRRLLQPHPLRRRLGPHRRSIRTQAGRGNGILPQHERADAVLSQWPVRWQQVLVERPVLRRTVQSGPGRIQSVDGPYPGYAYPDRRRGGFREYASGQIKSVRTANALSMGTTPATRPGTHDPAIRRRWRTPVHGPAHRPAQHLAVRRPQRPAFHLAALGYRTRSITVHVPGAASPPRVDHAIALQLQTECRDAFFHRLFRRGLPRRQLPIPRRNQPHLVRQVQLRLVALSGVSLRAGRG